MNEQQLLSTQILDLQREIGRTRKLVEQAIEDARLLKRAGVLGRSCNRLRAQLSPEFQKQREALDDVLRDLASPGKSLRDCWNRFDDIKDQCFPIFRECLALVEGLHGRAAGLDDGMCRIADVLLNVLNDATALAWDSFTILAEGEAFFDLARLIRLRFPGINIWNLPIVGHEFGHFVAQEIRHKKSAGGYFYPFLKFVVQESGSDPVENKHLWERFADVFSVYALGPSPAFACILVRFDPNRAHRASDTHPSDSERVYLMLKTLETMDTGGIGKQYSDVIQELRETWESSVRATGQTIELDNNVLSALDRRFSNIYESLIKHYPSARYDSWTGALNLTRILKDDQASRSPEDTAISDVLNAAWLCRCTITEYDPYRVAALAERARAACHEIVLKERSLPTPPMKRGVT